MGKVVITEFLSLDGVMQAPGGPEGDYPHAGWTFTFNRGDDGDAFKSAENDATTAHLLGRVTYEAFAAAWPSVPGPFAERFNAIPKYVVSSTLTNPTWGDTTVLNNDFVDDVTKLKDSIDGDIVVHGSRQLAQGLIEHDLADQLNLMVFPIVLGSGARLFGDAETPKRFALTDMTKVGEGVVVLTLNKAS
jgi:dihydrofolate reductase